jgi:hypothetical protein
MAAGSPLVTQEGFWSGLQIVPVRPTSALVPSVAV